MNLQGHRRSSEVGYDHDMDQSADDLDVAGCDGVHESSLGGIHAKYDFPAVRFGLVGFDRVGQGELRTDNRANFPPVSYTHLTLPTILRV